MNKKSILLILIFLVIDLLGAENNKSSDITIDMIIKPGINKIKKNILMLESRNIGIFGFYMKSDKKEFDIDEIYLKSVKILYKDIGKIKDIEIINAKKLSKAENKYSIFETRGIERRQMLNNYFDDVDMDMLVTGQMIYKNNVLTISLSYIDKKRLSEIKVLNKIIDDKRVLMSFFKKKKQKLKSEKYVSPVVTKTNTRFLLYNKDAKKVSLSFKEKDKLKNKPMRMKKLKNEQGFWSLTLKLKPGMYKYLYIVDGKEQFDLKNPNRVDDGFAGIISIVEVKR